MLYPSLPRIRSVSVVVAREVIRQAQSEDLDTVPSLRAMDDEALDRWIESRMYDPRAENGFVELEREKAAGGSGGVLEVLGAAKL